MTTPHVASEGLRFGARRVDLGAGVVYAPEGASTLTRREGELLAYLAERAPHTVPRAELLARVWGGAPSQDTRSVDAAVHRLRVKIGDVGPTPRWLLTVHGAGYRLEPDADPATGAAVEALPGRAAELAWLREALIGPGRVDVLGPPGIGRSRLLQEALRAHVGALRVPLREARGAADLWTNIAGAMGLGVAEPRRARGRALARLAAQAGALLWLDDVLPELAPAIEALREDLPRLTLVLSGALPLPGSADRRLLLRPLAPAVARRVLAEVACLPAEAVPLSWVRAADGVPGELAAAGGALRALGLASLEGLEARLGPSARWVALAARLAAPERALLKATAALHEGWDLLLVSGLTRQPQAEVAQTVQALAEVGLVQAVQPAEGTWRALRPLALALVDAQAPDERERWEDALFSALVRDDDLLLGDAALRLSAPRARALTRHLQDLLAIAARRPPRMAARAVVELDAPALLCGASEALVAAALRIDLAQLPDVWRAAVRRVEALHLHRLDDRAQAWARLADAEACCPANAPALRARLLSTRAHLHLLDLAPVQARADADAAVALGAHHALPLTEGAALALRATARARTGDTQGAEADLRAAERLFRLTDEPERRCRALADLGLTLLYAGRPAEAREQLERAAAVEGVLPSPLRAAGIALHLARAEALLGALDAACAHARVAADTYQAAGLHRSGARAWRQLAELALLDDAPEVAAQAAATALTEARAAADPDEAALAEVTAWIAAAWRAPAPPPTPPAAESEARALFEAWDALHRWRAGAPPLLHPERAAALAQRHTALASLLRAAVGLGGGAEADLGAPLDTLDDLPLRVALRWAAQAR